MERLTSNIDYCETYCENEKNRCHTYSSCINRRSYEKAKDYEDAEEQGLLLRLPCPIRSEVWKIVKQRDNFSDEPYRIATCVNFRLDMISEIGKTVFLTKEEAEQALKDMQGV